MSEQSLVESLDRLSLNQLSKSSPSRLPPFQLKRSRSNQTPVPPLPGSNHQQQQHDSSPTSPPPPSSKHSNNNNNNKSSNLSHVPCKFFKQGTCTAGANCIFSHNPDPTSESAVCKYFLKGNCKFGSKCALLHTLSPYTPDGRKLLMSQHRNNGAVAGAQSIASRSVGDTLSLRSPPLGSPIDFGPHMFSPVRGAAAAATGGFFDQSRYDMLSTSADARISGFSHLSAAIHRQQDPFMFAEEQQQRRYSPRDAFFGGGGGIRASTSPRETSELSSSPFTQRTLFMHPTSSPSASASMLSSSLSRTGSSFHQQTALHSIPERSQSTSRFLDVPHHNSYYGTGDYLDLEDADDDLNDAMLPSSLNELLTPTELQLRKAREQQRQQQLGGGAGGGLSRGHSYASVVDRSPSESMLGFHHRSPLDMAHSPSLGLTHSLSPSSSPWQQLPIFADDDQQQLPSARGAINIPKGVKSEAPVIGLEEESYRRKKLLDNTGPFSPFDDDGPFYMEEANGTDADSQEQQQQQQQQRHTTPFEFPSLISIQKSS